MAQTFWSGPLASGDRPPGSPGGSNVGLVELTQTVTIPFTAALVQSAQLNVPSNSRIVDILVDVLTVFNPSGTSTLTIGNVAAGNQYASGVDVKTAAVRIRPTFTAAQLAAIGDTGVLPLFFTVTNVGSNPTTGNVRVTVEYIQTRGD